MPTVKEALIIAAVSVLTMAIVNRLAQRVPVVAAVVNG